ncbi:MAG: phosphoserine phosphatase SerB [Rhodovulum sulfidophilum]|uniref:Phosphoserine phosphatase n=1 Tax=Rhodovulum sulfidophilum TaxID=35806 RepID=A0A2W5PWT7_RHOSU|nr:MAG: phosphoserine phosphatase SerB [Rhodovulum sulfidophilum]
MIVDAGRAAGGVLGAPRRLAASAVEVEVETAPEAGAFETAAADISIDANVVPAEGRRKRLLIADMDSTIIGVECIDELADFAGVKPMVAEITERAMRGELDFEAALRARVALLRGLPVSALEECYAARVHLNPGARALVRTMTALGADTALISGGFTFFTSRVAAAAGFAHNQANTLLAEDGALTGEVSDPILGREAKHAALLRLANGFGPEAAIAVGDGANDLDMVVAAGLGVAYKAKPALAVAADARIDHSDLTALLALQGIPESDWVRD